jgi:hypothetical protein
MESLFDPTQHLMKVSGQDYLPVKFRLVWFRADHPDGIIKTEMLEHVAGEYAVFYASVTTSSGGYGSGHGSETKGDFKDYLEKAEMKAIGRALAALGYGTQFAHEMNDGGDQNRPVDSPVELKPLARDRSTSRNVVPDAPQATETRNEPIQGVSQGQLNVIAKHQKDLGWSDADMKLLARAKNRSSLAAFTAEEARNLIHFMSDPAKADPYMAGLRSPKQGEMIPNSNIAERARS